MYCSSSPCSTAYRYSRWISPVPANSGHCPLGSVWTWSPIASVVTGAAVPLRVGQICHAATAATAVAPAPYKNARRFIDDPRLPESFRFIPDPRSSGRLIIASPLTDGHDTSARLVDLSRQKCGAQRPDVLVGDAARGVDDEGLRQAPYPVVDGDAAAGVASIRIRDAELVQERLCPQLLVLGVDAEEDDDVLVLELSPHRLQHRRLRAARRAPGGPEVQEDHLAPEVL